MSPKIGKVERRVIDLLRESLSERGIVSLTTSSVIEALYGPEATWSQGQSVRRAVRSLQAKGLVEAEALPGGRLRAVRLGRGTGGQGKDSTERGER